MPDRAATPAGPKRVFRRRRKCVACDSCSKRKIQCDRASPKCNWCDHHDLPCSYTRDRAVRPQRRDPSPPVNHQSSPLDPQQSHAAPETATGVGDFKLHFPGLALGNICVFNGLPFFSPSGREWIRARTGEEVHLSQYYPSQEATGRSAPSSTLSLPAKSLLYQCLDAYQSSIFSQIFPYIHPPLFRYTIEAACLEPQPRATSARACVYAFIAASAAWADDDSIPNTEAYALEAHRLLPRDAVTVDGLQTLLILTHYTQSILGDVFGVELLLASATRLALHLGGHIAPRDTDGVSAELRHHTRNLFWLSYIFNQELSLRTGLPPSLDDANCDLTLPDAATTTTCSPFFVQFIRLSRIQSHIYRRLYSVSALSQPDSHLLHTIRALDTQLDDWKASLPAASRPTLTPRSSSAAASDPPASILELQYHYCMATIHQASGRCRPWTQNQNTLGAGSSLAISVEASRSLLCKVADSRLPLHRYNLLFCLPYFTAAMIHLFCDVLLHPSDPRCEADLTLVEKCRQHMRAQLWPHAPVAVAMQVRFVEELSGEIQRLARRAIQRSSEA